MKEFKCYDCEERFKAVTREELLSQLYDHYMKNHYETITGGTAEEKKAWMIRFEKDWDETPEII